MTKIALQDGKVVLRDGKVGTEQACCCGGGGCNSNEDCPLTLPEECYTPWAIGYPSYCCEDFYPAKPYNCCNGQCKEFPCFPGVVHIFKFRTRDECPPEGEVIGPLEPGTEWQMAYDWSNYSCEDSVLGGVVPFGQWTITGCCEFTDVVINPFLLLCYEFLGIECCTYGCFLEAGECA